VREKHCWLVGGRRLLLEWCERKILLAGAGAEHGDCCHSFYNGLMVVYWINLEIP